MFSNLEMCVQCKLIVEPPKFSLKPPPKLDFHSIDGLVDLLQLNDEQLKVIELINQNKCNKLVDSFADKLNTKSSEKSLFELENSGKLILCIILITILVIISIIFVFVVRHLRKSCVKLTKELNYDFDKNNFQISDKSCHTKTFSSHYYTCENEPAINNYYQRVYEDVTDNFSNTITKNMQNTINNSKPPSPSLISNESSVASTKSLIGSVYNSNVNTNNRMNTNVLIIKDNAWAIPSGHQYFQVLNNGNVNTISLQSNDIHAVNTIRACNLNFNVHELPPNVLLMTS